MSDEKIQIEIVDKVASTIEPKIAGIAAGARAANHDLERLKAAIAAIDGSALNRLATVLNRSQKVFNDTAISAQRLATEQQKTSAAAIAASTAQQRLQTVATQTATAQQQLAAAIQRTNAAQAQTATATANAEAAQSRAAQAALRLQAAQDKAAQAAGAMQREGEKLKRELFPLYAAQQQYNESVLRFNALIAKGAINARTYDAAIARAKGTLDASVAAYNKAASGANSLANAQNRVTSSVDKSNSAFSNYLRNAVRVATAGLTASAILRSADAYTTLRNKLQLVSESEGRVADLTEKLFDIANRTRAPVEETATAFTRFDRALAQLGATQTESLRLTETVNKMLIVSGSTAGEAASGLLQLSQAFNKGKLDGDEFRTVMELMPSVADAIAKQMGVTRGELLKLAPQGKITADIMRKAFAETADDIDAKFGKTVPTLAQSFTVLANNFKKAVGEFNQATGIFDGLSKGIIFLSQHLREIAVGVAAVGAGLAVAFAPSIIGAITAAAVAVKAFTLAMLANPVILLASALAGLIAYLVIFRDESETAGDAVSNIGFAMDALVGTIKGLGIFVGRFFAQVIDVSVDAFKKGYNAIVSFMEKSTNFILNGINYIREKAGMKPIELVNFDRMETSGAQWQDVGELWADSLNEGFDQQGGAIQKMLDGTAAKELAAAAKRNAVKPSSGGAGEEKRALTLAKINLQLDNEIARLNQLAPIREQQAKFDTIEEQLLGRKITLTNAEAASIKERIAIIENGKTVQTEMDRIYEESVGTLRTYNDVQKATAHLLAVGAISAQDAQRAIFGAREAYLNSLDPLRQFNKEMEDQYALLKLLPREREIEQQVQQVVNQNLAENIELTKEQIKEIRERLKIQQEMNIASQAEAAIWESTVGARQQQIADLTAIAKLKAAGAITSGDATQKLGAIIGPEVLEGTKQQIQAEMEVLKYRQEMIEKAHADGILEEEGYSAAIMKINADRFSLETNNTQRFLGGLAGLMNSGNKRLFEIGKKAAIANAVISGTEAVLNAMAIKPWYVGAALAVAQAATSAQQIATIRASKPPTGYMSGGYTGNGAINQAAGIVHGREFVMNAGATSRIGVENLQALQNGAANVQTTNNVSGVNVSIQNFGTTKEFEVQQLSANDVRIIARDEVAKGAPDIVAAEIGNPNSKVSKSLNRNTAASRRR